MHYAEVAVNTPVHSTFHYHIPPELEGRLRPGHLVRVGFGTAMQPGLVLALHTQSPVAETKPVLELLDPDPALTPAQLDLALWMSQRYLAPPGPCLWLMLPPGITGHATRLLRLLQSDAAPENPAAQAVVELLRRHQTRRLDQIKTALRGQRGLQQAVDALLREGVISAEPALSPPAVSPKLIRTAALAIPPGRVPDVARHLGRKSAPADLLEVIAATPEDPHTLPAALELAGVGRSALNKLRDAGYVIIEKTGRTEPDLVFLALPPEEVAAALLELRGGQIELRVLELLAAADLPLPVETIYAQTGARDEHLRRLADEGLITPGEQQVWRDSLAGRAFAPALPPPLTPEQQAAWDIIEARIKEQVWGRERPAAERIFLLHGVTGSGKTEIYLQAIALTLAQGRQAVLLVPEIALTAQTIRRVAARFPGQVAVVHGSLSSRERYDTWSRARRGEIGVVVGTRSALFTPLPDVGLIVMDEEHDGSYKQSPPFPPPCYHTREAAEQMVARSGGLLLLGSATPDLSTYYRAQRGQLVYLALPGRIMGHREHILEQAQQAGVGARYRPLQDESLMIDLPPVQVVDMRAELKAGNRGMFSRALQEALGTVLERREQAILYLNRRGQATYVFCRDCGYVAACPRCSTPLTYHRAGTALRCHHCGHQEPPPGTCPSCGSARIRYFGAGTQQVEAELRRLFPQARPLRWDADTAAAPDQHEAILQRFIDHEADVLVGTQMIAKGLDLPLVTLVGVVSADMGLALPDFRAGERAFQLLTQVAGRAGRGVLGGQVVLQTYRPEHYAVAAAAGHDYMDFYRRELAYRRELGYPPFRRLARLLFRYPTAARAREQAERAAALLGRRISEARLTDIEMIGPAPCFFEKLEDHYRWHLLLRGADPAAALEGLSMSPGWSLDLDPVDLL